MAWLKLEDTFHDHPKIRKAARLLKVNEAEVRGYVAGLWSWALRHAPDGDLSNFDAEDIADVCGRESDGDDLIEVFVSVRLLDMDPKTNGIGIHGYLERGGTYAETRRRARNRNTSPALSRDVPGHDGTKRPQDTSVPRCPKMSRSRGEEKRVEEKRREENNTKSFNNKPDTEPLALVPTEAAPPSRTSSADLSKFIDAWNHGVREAKTHHGASGKVSEADPPSPRSTARDERLRRATKAFPDPEQWRLAAMALSVSWQAMRPDAYDGYSLPWLLGKSKSGQSARLEEWMSKGERLARGEYPPRSVVEKLKQRGLSEKGAVNMVNAADWLRGQDAQP